MATASSTGNAGDTPAEMTPHEVDAVLAGLAEVVPQLIADYRTADAEATRWGEAAETYVENKSERCQPDPRRAITEARAAIAHATSRAARRTAREMTAWWADAATHAVIAAALDRPVLRAHLTAADPSAFLDEDDLNALPAMPEHHRRLVKLAASLGGAEMTRSAEETVELFGMALRWSPDEEPEVVNDVFPESRRRRIWGTRHRRGGRPDAHRLHRRCAGAFKQALVQVGVIERADTWPPLAPLTAAERDAIAVLIEDDLAGTRPRSPTRS